MGTETGQIDATLEERGNSYGDFTIGTYALGSIMESCKTIYKHKNHKNMPERDIAALNYIAMKMIRIAATPNHIDSWHDIQGYAKLAEDMYKWEARDVTQD